MKSVVIQSIGSANPSVASVLSEVLSVPSDVVLKLLYRCPSVLFHEVDETLATNAHSLLVQLGLEASVEGSVADFSINNELFDVAVHLTEPKQLFSVSKNLAQFLGCTEQESLQLLLKNPSVVLGSVSKATAIALGKRLGVEISYSNPLHDSYILLIKDSSEDFLRRFVLVCDKIGVKRQENVLMLQDLSYDLAQELWRQFGSKGAIVLFNQRLLRYHISLIDFDIHNAQHRQILNERVGIPEELLAEVHNNLPLLIHEFLDQDTQSQLIQHYQILGLQVRSEAILSDQVVIEVADIPDPDAARAIIATMFKDTDLSLVNTNWQSPQPLPIVLGRYLAAHLETVGCTVSFQYS